MGLDHYIRRTKNGCGEDCQEEVVTWRKSNPVHGWFCRRLNNGDEINCEDFKFSREDLEDLRSALEEVVSACRGAVCRPADYATDKDCERDWYGEPVPAEGPSYTLGLDDEGDAYKDLWKTGEGGLADHPFYLLPPEVVDICEELMPVWPGFFFGNRVYSVAYATDCYAALIDVRRILNEWDEGYTYTYSAWW